MLTHGSSFTYYRRHGKDESRKYHALVTTAGFLAVLAFELQYSLADKVSCPLDNIAESYILVSGIKAVLRGASLPGSRRVS